MGNAVAYEGHKITDKSVTQNYTARVYNPCKYWDAEYGCEGGYDYPNDSANKTVKGTLKTGSTNVYINNKSATYKSGSTDENCTWSEPSNYYSGASLHSSSTGSINGGSSTVFVNGKAIARKGDSVTTHESATTTIQEGSSNVFAG